MTTEWLPIIVTLRSKDRRVKPHEVSGEVPYDNCPLAIHPAFSHSHKGWKPDKGWWMVTHRPTGFSLGDIECPEKEQAQQLLLGSAPSFPGWLMATGDSGDLATGACRVWFRAACAVMGIECATGAAA